MNRLHRFIINPENSIIHLDINHQYINSSEMYSDFLVLTNETIVNKNGTHSTIII